MLLKDSKAPEEPPAYHDNPAASPPVPAASSPLASSSSLPDVLPGPDYPAPPANYVNLKDKNRSVSGNWSIDTSLNPPTSLLSPLEEGDLVRPNLKLYSHNGSVTANIRLITPEEGELPRATLDVSSHNGGVIVTIVCTA